MDRERQGREEKRLERRSDKGGKSEGVRGRRENMHDALSSYQFAVWCWFGECLLSARGELFATSADLIRFATRAPH